MTTVPIRPGDLRVAQRHDPIGIDDRRPTLSWRIAEPRDARQTAYRILVASSRADLEAGRADLWDSGRVESANSLGIAYDGIDLRSRDRCFWQVTVWDASGAGSPSEIACWEMGILDPADWQGDWLAAETADERDERLAGTAWFGDAASPATFRHVFDTTDATEVRLLVASDGLVTSVSCDGVDSPVPVWHEHAFGSPPAMRFGFPIGPGRHTIVVEAKRHPNPLMKATVALSGQLRLTAADGTATYRAIDTWETLDADGGWTAAAAASGKPWIAPPAGGARLLRRAFALRAGIVAARLHVAALGGYEMTINGRRVGADELQSEPTEYRDFVPYRVHDVTELLQAGGNVIGATVADGSYASYVAPVGRYGFAPPPRRLRAMLVIECDDGSTEWIVTDGDWRSAASCITSSEIYNGEHVDYRLDEPGWDRPGFDDRHWEACWSAPAPEGRIVAPLGQPIRATERVRPVSIDARPDGRFIIDFGQNFAGRMHLRVRGVAGQAIVVRHAEVLADDGELDVRNLRAAEAADRYVLYDAAEIVLRPRFSYHGFRYAEISGVASLDPGDVEGVVLTSNLPEVGQVEIAQPIIQQLWSNTLWSQRSNFVGIPTDCPQRDERLGWTGDAQIFWDTAAFNMDVGAYTRSYCREMRAGQAEGGAFPIWAPKGLFAHPVTAMATPGWSDAGVELPYVAYLHSGDRQVVDENWAAMTRYVEGVLEANPDGVWRNARGADFGDHLSLDSVAFRAPSTPQDLIGTAMLARDMDRMLVMAEGTGRVGELEHWRARSAYVRSAFATAFIDDDGVVGNGSHASYILALRLDLVPADLRALSARLLGQAIRDRGSLLTTGFLGTPLALDALADIGEVELAYTLLLRTEYPSWGYMVEHGATTIWERWDGDTGDVAMNSFNHYALGAVCAFLYRRVCGIEPLAPGFARIRIAPLPDKRIPSANAVYLSAMGWIASGWRWIGADREYTITIPPNTTAELVLPGHAVGPGFETRFDESGGVTRGEVGPGTYVLTSGAIAGDARR